MVDISIRIEGLDNIINLVDEFEQKDEEFCLKLLQRIAERFLTILQSLAPFKTGAYAESWQIQALTSQFVTIGTPMELLYFVLEFGSKPHLIEPVAAEVLHFFSRDGVEVFTKLVHHPGTFPHPHVQPALDQVQIEMEDIIVQTAKETFTILGS